MRRDYPDHPLVGVGAVIFLAEEVVLVRRGQAPAYGQWSLPGGAVELGETLVEAVVREVAEEVGLEVEVGDLVAVLERIYLDAEGRVRFHYVLLDFLCRSRSGSLRTGSDVLSCSRAPLESLAEYRLHPETTEVVKRAHLRVRGESVPLYLSRLVLNHKEHGERPGG